MTPALAVEATPPPATEAVPQRLGRFVIGEEIGRGSTGVVYSATDPVLGRDVAIKAIPLVAQGAAPGAGEASFLQEAKIAAGLNHPSIVTVFDAGKTDSIAYIAMERLNGADLHHWLDANGSMAPEQAAALIARVADAVHFAHRRGLIHRDIKPSNIFLGRDMKPKVLDFGIALAQGKQGGPDEARKLIGTPNYMSPEQALGRALDARSDVFSIGTILYELISGHRAFDGGDVDEILTKVVKETPPALASWRPGVSPVMEEIVFRALAKDPAQRYQTAAQLRNDLAAFAGRPVAPATTPPGDYTITALPRAGRRLPGPAALAATAIGIASLSLAFALWYREQTPAEVAPAAVVPPPPAPEPVAKPAPLPAPVVQTAPKPVVLVRAKPAPPPPPPEPAAPPPPGTLSLAIVPWGQVLVDGNEAGIAPPLSRLELPAGSHTLEIRNGSATPFTAQIEIEPGKTLAFQHHF